MSRYPIIPVEMLDEGMVIDNYWCECGKGPDVARGRFKESNKPDADWSDTRRCECNRDVEMSSQSFERFYRRLDTGEELGGSRHPHKVHADLPAGCAYFQIDPAYAAEQSGPDGKCLVVVLPDGHHWYVDSTSSSNGRWKRKGSILDGTLDIKPSIRVGNPQTYHGHVNNGWLESTSDSPC